MTLRIFVNSTFIRAENVARHAFQNDGRVFPFSPRGNDSKDFCDLRGHLIGKYGRRFSFAFQLS